MTVKQSHYEDVLARYSRAEDTIALLRRHRPYLEAIPSLRRPNESLIPIPFPLIRLHDEIVQGGLNNAIGAHETICLPCELGAIMCDPDWKIKLGIEIFILVHRPNEDLSDLLLRWRQIQVLLSKGYEWVMPHRYRHIFCDASERIFPLFVLFDETPERVRRGLEGALLPYVVESIETGDLADEPLDESLFASDDPSPSPIDRASPE